MAKVTLPLASLTATGTFGDAITYSVWRGKRTARLKSNPSNPKTAGQMAQRAILSVVGKATKSADREGSEVAHLRSVTPAGQVWSSHFGSLITGPQNVNFEAAQTAYNLPANSAKKTIFDNAAAAVGIEGVNLGGVNTKTAGLVLAAAYEASRSAGSPNTGAAIAAATQTEVEDYAEALTGQTILP